MSPEFEAEIMRRVRMPYHRVIRGEPTEGYLAAVVELPGCVTDGDTPAEALERLDEAMAAWIQSALLDGAEIPDPHTGGVKLSA